MGFLSTLVQYARVMPDLGIRVASIVDGGDDAGALSRSAADKGCCSEEKAHLCALVAARATTGFRGWG